MTTPHYDIAIIGGGIVGLATALALSALDGYTIIVLEAESELAQHQTGRNSGVIHSGLYYKPGSLKAQNCTAGREAMYQFCQEHDIPHDRCGKVVVATKPEEVPALNILEERGRANGLQGMRRIGPEEIREHEPYVAGVDGLFIPETGIVNYATVSAVYARLIKQAGGVIQMNSRVIGVTQQSDELVIHTSQGDVRSSYLVNCAGLYSDKIAIMCGVEPGVQIVPFRGEYYELIPEREYLVKNLIYPVPNPQFPFLGVHYTRMIDGGIEAGPNAVLAFKREGYHRTDFSAAETWEIFSYGGFRKLAAQYWQTGLGEIYRSFSKRAFVKALQGLIPEIQEADVVAARAGVRAQALAPNGKLVDDFHIVETARMVHVLNAPSPAATSSITIGETIANMLGKQLKISAE